jgi:hypothetical protein
MNLKQLLIGGVFMHRVTKFMVKEFNIKQVGYDFMGYKLKRGDIYSFHHLIVSKSKGGPYAPWNGAVLCESTAHTYLHVIEWKDYDMFCAITSEMIDMNVQGYLSYPNISRINDVLNRFEIEYCSAVTLTGKKLIKEDYTKRICRK